jgi:hypothetical protein
VFYEKNIDLKFSLTHIRMKFYFKTQLLFFGGTRVLTQGLMLARQALHQPFN